MAASDGAPRALSHAVFGNAAFAEVAASADAILTAGGAGATVTTRQVAAATGHSDSVVRPVMQRLAAGGLLLPVPKPGPVNGPQPYERGRPSRWGPLLGLVSDLSGLAAHMVEIMTPLARDRGSTIRLDATKPTPKVRGDRDQLLRVVENLLENAMKYGGAGEVVVRIFPSEDGRLVTLSVTDEGPGIPPEHIPRLTERFYRVNEAESRARGGTGLGLAIVKHVVGRHRGRAVRALR